MLDQINIHSTVNNRPYALNTETDVVQRFYIIEQFSIAKQFLKQTTNDELSQFLSTLSQQLDTSNAAEEASDKDSELQQRLYEPGGRTRKAAADPSFEVHERCAVQSLARVRVALAKRDSKGIKIDWVKISGLLHFESARVLLGWSDSDGHEQRDVELRDV